ncbi:GDSL-type esterase/lipase family protein [Subtercola sp. YIM 133946]|uniref:GDSL-type esterase/lipase family protein n=1 Tax=Subtercola sp. YIM 133946 TaxID=3118909 RepID=UPI002F94A8E0
MSMTNWQVGWVRALADVRAFDSSSTNVTVRMRVLLTTAGDRFRIELSNAFGETPLVIGGAAVSVTNTSAPILFDGSVAANIPAGETRWSDAIELAVRRGDEVVVDLYLPETTRHETGNFARTPLELSAPGEHVGSRVFPAVATPMIPAPDGTEMAIPVPFLRAIATEGHKAEAVVACLGDSITAGGWPEEAANLLAGDRDVVMLNLGIAGNRLRVDPGPETASFGRSGLSRFDDDVLAIAGVTDVVIALGTNDLGLPGSVTPADELPTAAEIIDAYSLLIDRAAAAGLHVLVATITPFMGAEGLDAARDRLRNEVNEWIRVSAPAMVDFDKAIRSPSSPSELADEFDSGDHLHPNELGEATLGAAIAAVLRARSARPIERGPR